MEGEGLYGEEFLIFEFMMFGDSAVGEMGQSEIWGSRKYGPI